MDYQFSLEGFDESLNDLMPLYKLHYAEMTKRMEAAGINVSPFNPRLSEYSRASIGGWLLTIVCRFGGEAVGYCNVYITNDMHNGDLIAQEDALFMLKDHRNGVGKKLVQFGIEELGKRGVKRLHVSAVTDLRVAKLWERMGFKHAAQAMVYNF
jgi:ribosomal protein S18 acetylase RimI-like enzyme